MRISDWSSDVCSSDLVLRPVLVLVPRGAPASGASVRPARAVCVRRLMGRTRVRITLDKKAVARLKAPDGDIDTFTRRVAAKARDRAKLNLPTDGSVDTGRLRNSGQYQRLPSSRRATTYTVGTHLD